MSADRPNFLTNMLAVDPVTVGNMTGHMASLGLIVSSFLGYLPSLAAGGALLWYCIAIWESKTVQSWRHKRIIRGRSIKPTPDNTL